MNLDIKVNIFTVLERFSEAGEDHVILINHRATSGAVPKDPYPNRISPKLLENFVDPITTLLSTHYYGWSV